MKIKNLATKLILGAAAIACVFTFTACGNGEAEKGNGGTPENQASFAQQQVDRAKKTYNSFYNKQGGLFSASTAKSAARAVAVADEDSSDEITFDTVRQTLNKYQLQNSNTVNEVNSYVADIFAYSQVQTSIIEAFGEQSLTNVYALTYETVDWNSNKSGYEWWINQTKLLSAAFAGADLENGNVYCTQAHKSQGKLVLANLEYDYNSDGDMGVTTINWHSDGSFEYHYCSAGTYEILQAYGRYSDSGEITLNTFRAVHKNGERNAYMLSESDKNIVFGYVQSEIARINGKIEELQEKNGRERELDGSEEKEGENVGVCSVKMDFDILSGMLLK